MPGTVDDRMMSKKDNIVTKCVILTNEKYKIITHLLTFYLIWRKQIESRDVEIHCVLIKGVIIQDHFTANITVLSMLIINEKFFWMAVRILLLFLIGMLVFHCLPKILEYVLTKRSISSYYAASLI